MKLRYVISIVLIMAAMLIAGCTGSQVASPTPTAHPTQDAAPADTPIATPAPTPDAGFSRSNPIGMGFVLEFSATAGKTPIEGTIVLEKVASGDTALQMLQDYNSLYYKDGEPTDKEYYLAKFKFDVTKYNTDKAYTLDSGEFAAVSDKGVTHGDYIAIFSPLVAGDLYEGQSREGWVLFEIPRGAKVTSIAYGRDSDGSGGMWFSTSTS